jgi:hypothetical protein
VVPLVIGHLLAQKIPIDEKVLRYLEQLKVKTELKGTYRIAHNNLLNGRPLTRLTKRQRKMNVDYLSSFRRLQEVASSRLPDSRTIQRAEALSDLHRNFSRELGRLPRAATGLIESVNLVRAISGYLDAQEMEKDKKALAMLGASSDMVAFILSMGEELKSKWLVMRLGLRVGSAAFSVVAATIDGIQFWLSADEAWNDRRDYVEAVGWHIAGAGAAMSVLGGAIVIAQAITTGAAGGPLGIVLFTIGAVLSVTGTALAAWFKSTEYEIFAAFSVFGRKHGEKTIRPKWSPVSLPCQKATEEARVLVALLSQFSIKCSSDIYSTSLTIRPGLVYAQSVLEIDALQSWGNYSSNQVRLQVNMEYDEVFQLNGKPLKTESSIDRDPKGRVTYIHIRFELEEQPPVLLQFAGLKARVRLRLDKELSTPLHGHWVEATFTPVTSVASAFDSDNSQATSLDRARMVDARTFLPVPP